MKKYRYILISMCLLFLLVGCSQWVDNGVDRGVDHKKKVVLDPESVSLPALANFIQSSLSESSDSEVKAAFSGRQWGYYTTDMKKITESHRYNSYGVYTPNYNNATSCISLDYDTANEPTHDLKEIQFWRFSYFKWAWEQLQIASKNRVITERRILDCTSGRGYYFYVYKAIANDTWTNDWVIGKNPINGRFFIRKGMY
jgi:hypothetical protein